ncbi:hypothetical protein [Neptunomonas sp.]|uniref:hypothetical protein n=1 Tax=Neptunomonas sp. TaxID=1971898 RepID=UPI003562BA96
MATSGSYDFSQNRDQLIKDAFVEAGVLRPDETPESDENVYASNTLNRFLKAWQAYGLKLWVIKPAFLFLEKDKHEYNLGPTGDNWTESFVSTEMRAAAAAAATTMEVDSTTGMTAADIALVEQDDGVLHEDTVASVTDGDTFELTTGLAGGVSIDATVYTYTTKAQRPIRVQQVVYCDKSSDYEHHMYQLGREDYWNLSNKTVDSRPTEWYFDPQLTNSKLRIYGEPETVEDYLRVIAHFPFEDMDAAANDFGFPQEWLDPIHLELAARLARNFGAPQQKRKELREAASAALELVLGWDEEKADVLIQPDRQWLQNG